MTSAEQKALRTQSVEMKHLRKLALHRVDDAILAAIRCPQLQQLICLDVFRISKLDQALRALPTLSEFICEKQTEAITTNSIDVSASSNGGCPSGVNASSQVGTPYALT